MGVLTSGNIRSLTYEEIQIWKEHIKTHGLIQFINWYNKVKDINYDTLKWGDEIEMFMIKIIDEEKSAPLLNKAKDLLEILQQAENDNPGETETAWRPEMCEYMMESSPGMPYGGNIAHFNTVEANMTLRRKELLSLLSGKGENVVTVSTYPRLGIPDDFYPPIQFKYENNDVTRSLYVPDEVLNQLHPRFRNLAKMITMRKQRKVYGEVPIFRDVNTPNPFLEEVPDFAVEDKAVLKPNHVHLDSVVLGLGCGCLQVTFQACNVPEARILYDQQAVLAPIVMALSASSPCIKGYLLDTDTRWENISMMCDDRTEEELGLKPLKDQKFRLPKSRYSCVDMYISPDGEAFNDMPIFYHEEHLKLLLDGGIDEQLAKHVAHLFTRDPLAVYEEKLHISDEDEVDHFENINSTNWQSVRFKPPPPGSNIGWRVEMRPIETQLTDFENAAYVTFVVLLTRVILSYDLNLIIPMSKVEENMKRGVKRDAVLEQKFYFRKNLEKSENDDASYEEMTMNEIINGKGSEFPGLMNVIEFYLNHLDIDVDTRCTISQYLTLIRARASGEVMTTAKWIRSFIRSHPLYKFDSVVSKEITYDLMKKCVKISNGEESCPELFADAKTKTCSHVPESCKKMLEEVEKITKCIRQERKQELIA
ncbi:glutamate--cysteine ligase catalytic subunit isoform X1 [Hydra vulgaris]|uniref:glutamate--cysteine ligase catalytic subunit isoform X1 n=1 Tax=Hydra vulgaris TaxID=6087 RepID=UPI0002B42FB6|nr:glutamate--cysteine ligase catalytic subunit [Hydra vulgaris]